MDVETDVTNYDMDNHGPCITIDQDVKLTDNVNNALNAINSKEIDTFLPHYQGAAMQKNVQFILQKPNCINHYRTRCWPILAG